MFCLRIFESDSVKSDCSAHIFRKNDKIFKDLIQTVGLPKFTSFTVFLEILEKSSENDKKRL